MRKFTPRDVEATLVGSAGVAKDPKLSDGLVLADRLALIRELGKGGMGVVWLAKDKHLDREVAVKLISSNISAESQFQSRFRSEMKALAKCKHSNIVQIYSVFSWEGHNAFEMEYVPGQDVAGLIARHGQCDSLIVRQIAADIGDALTLIHRMGLVHRDIKPANIMLEKKRPVLMDFGLVLDEHASQRITNPGIALGTFGFMAPEQMNGSSPITDKADQYGLAATLLAMLLGLNALPLVIDWNCIQLRPYSNALKRALSNAPNQRFSSIKEFLSEFLRVPLVASEFDKESIDRDSKCGDCGGTGLVRLANQSGAIPCNRCYTPSDELRESTEHFSSQDSQTPNYTFNSFSGRLSVESSAVGDNEFARIIEEVDSGRVRWLELSQKPITDETLSLIAKQLPNLETLSLDACQQITPQGLLFLKPLPKLQKVFIEGCSNISIDSCPLWLMEKIGR